MDVNVSLDPVFLRQVDKIISLLTQAIQKDNRIMATMDEILAKVAQETTDIGSMRVFVQGLEDQIKAIPGMTPTMQAQIDSVFTSVDSNDKAIVDAMKVNVAPVPPTP